MTRAGRLYDEDGIDGPFEANMRATFPRVAIAHSEDSDCTVGPLGLCVGCGTLHADPCVECAGRGFHTTDCPIVAGDDTTDFAVSTYRHEKCPVCDDIATGEACEFCARLRHPSPRFEIRVALVDGQFWGLCFHEDAKGEPMLSGAVMGYASTEAAARACDFIDSWPIDPRDQFDHQLLERMQVEL